MTCSISGQIISAVHLCRKKFKLAQDVPIDIVIVARHASVLQGVIGYTEKIRDIINAKRFRVTTRVPERTIKYTRFNVKFLSNNQISDAEIYVTPSR